MSSRVLVITSNHNKLAGKPNGTYLPELTHALTSSREPGSSTTSRRRRGGESPGTAPTPTS